MSVAPLTSRARLTRVATKGGKEGGSPHPEGSEGDPRHGSACPKRVVAGWRRRGEPRPSSARKQRAGRGARGPPQPGRALPQHAARRKKTKGTPLSYSVRTSHAGRGERSSPGPGIALPQHAARERKKRGTPMNSSVRTSRTACRRGAGENPWNQRMKEGKPLSSVLFPRTAGRRRRG